MNNRTTTMVKRTAAKAETGPQATVTSGAASQPQNGQPTPEDAIRLGAYLKWEAAGKPSGDGTNFWLEAENELSQPTQPSGVRLIPR